MRFLLNFLFVLPLLAQPFQVGSTREAFGADPNRFQTPKRLDGYLPVLRSSYEHEGIRYEVTTAAGTTRVAMKNLTKTVAEAILMADGKTSRARLSAGQSMAIYPGSSAVDFQAALAKATATAKFVNSGALVQVPDERLNDVWRTLLAEAVPVVKAQRPVADLLADTLSHDLFEGPASVKADYAAAVRAALAFKQGTDLLLLHGAPVAWFQEGMRIRFERIEGASLDLVSEIGLQKNMQARIVTDGLARVLVRFRNPGKKALSRVEVNGQQFSDFDREGVVRLPKDQKQYDVKVFFD